MTTGSGESPGDPHGHVLPRDETFSATVGSATPILAGVVGYSDIEITEEPLPPQQELRTSVMKSVFWVGGAADGSQEQEKGFRRRATDPKCSSKTRPLHTAFPR